MSKLTILLISPTKLARVDVRAGKTAKVEKVWSRDTIEAGSLATLVDTALRLGKNRKRNILVATTRCWTGTVAVAPELMRDASADEQAQTISLEAEPFSGISAFDGASSSRALLPTPSGDARYWVTQIAGGDLREVESAVRTAGAKLLGVGHPAVPNLFQPASVDEAWHSLQTWDGTTFAARGIGDAVQDMATVSSGLQSARTIDDLDSFFPESGEPPTLQWIGLDRFPQSFEVLHAAENVREFDVSRENDLGKWATAWVQSQQAGTSGLPTITVPKKPMSNEVWGGISVALGLLMMAGCAAHYWFLNRELQKLDSTIADAKTQATMLETQRKQLKTIEEKRDKLIEDAALARAKSKQLKVQLTSATGIVRDNRRRWLSLVDTVVDVSEDSSWVNAIEGGDGEVTLAGLAINDAAVHRFASNISRSLQQDGWTAFPADTEIDPESKLVRFEIALNARQPNPKP